MFKRLNQNTHDESSNESTESEESLWKQRKRNESPTGHILGDILAIDSKVANELDTDDVKVEAVWISPDKYMKAEYDGGISLDEEGNVVEVRDSEVVYEAKFWDDEKCYYVLLGDRAVTGRVN
jgi:hypothetical protein